MSTTALQCWFADVYEKCSAPDCARYFSDNADDATSSDTPMQLLSCAPANATGWVPIRPLEHRSALVGFYASPDYVGPPLTVQIKNTAELGEECAIQLRPGEVCFALDDRYILPMNAVFFENVYMRLSDATNIGQVKCVWARMPTDVSRECATRSWTGELRSGSYFGMYGGCLGICKTHIWPDWIPLPSSETASSGGGGGVRPKVSPNPANPLPDISLLQIT